MFVIRVLQIEAEAFCTGSRNLSDLEGISFVLHLLMMECNGKLEIAVVMRRFRDERTSVIRVLCRGTRKTSRANCGDHRSRLTR